MNALYQELADRIRGEVTDLGRIVQRSSKAWLHAQKTPNEQDFYLDSAALNLHGFYSGLERLFELIARHVDRELPTGETWHRDLLQQIARDAKDIRPAVISQESAMVLDEYRRFRHLVRSVYTLNLEPGKMENLISSLPGLWSQVQAELLAFADFLEELAKRERP
jgi:hypothetical protein